MFIGEYFMISSKVLRISDVREEIEDEFWVEREELEAKKQESASIRYNKGRSRIEIVICIHPLKIEKMRAASDDCEMEKSASRVNGFQLGGVPFDFHMGFSIKRVVYSFDVLSAEKYML
ncbi:hypothetical protein LXL04_005391 [Taraxacum kok-saghyz]